MEEEKIKEKSAFFFLFSLLFSLSSLVSSLSLSLLSSLLSLSLSLVQKDAFTVAAGMTTERPLSLPLSLSF